MAGKNLGPRLVIVAVMAAATLLLSLGVLAQPAPKGSAAPGGPSASASVSPPSAPPEPVDPRVQELEQIELEVRALIDGDLEAEVDPKALFPIDPFDPKAVRLQRARLTLLLAAIDEAARRDAPVESADAGADGGANRRDAAVESGADGGVEDPLLPSWVPEDFPPKDVPEAVWLARVAVDRARLAFYDLSDAERARLLEDHAAKSAPPAPEEATDQAVDEAERKGLEAEADRKRALEAASRARTEAHRAVAEEQARLLGVAKDQAGLEARFARSRGEILARVDKVLAWQRKARELRERAAAGDIRAEVDRTYDELRVSLREARERLAAALDGVGAASEVPGPGPDALVGLPPDVDTSAARAVREKVEAGAQKLLDTERALRLEASKGAYDEVVALNKERLALYALLSGAKRSAIAGFGAAGVDQARAEAWQVSLVVRYHVRATSRWVSSFRSGEKRGQSALTATVLALRWLLPVALFIAWVRRAPALVDKLRAGAKERSKASLGTSFEERVVEFFARVRRPLEWLLLVMTVLWLLPGDMRTLWEIQIVETVLVWALGGQLVVAAVDATFSDRGGVRASRMQTAHLRLRSFKLLGRAVVSVGLLLAISSHLVGQGTIYEWVWSTCWLGLVPLAIVLGAWWREVVFYRVDLKRRKSAFDEWVLKEKTGWRGVLGGLVGGAHLLAVNGYRSSRVWVTRFELSRRVLAYLFLRGMSKRAENGERDTLAQLPQDVFEQLGPDVLSAKHVASVADDQLKVIAKQIEGNGGGVFAVVGERGAGKTTTLRRVAGLLKDVAYVECGFDGARTLTRAVAEVCGKGEDVGLAALAAELDAANEEASREGALLIDDAHRLIQPRMGGLAEFDEILAVARRSSRHVAWVFAFDEIIWQFFERARGARPLFDEVITLDRWREEGIARLLVTRSKAARVTPSFERLLEDVPKDADEIDLQEANERASTGYYRLLWDYAGGNPGVALHMWRRSLGLSSDGETIVKLFAAPDEYELDSLPDNAVFVLRAVLQLDRALPEDLGRATMLPMPAIRDALRYSVARGYLKESDGRYYVTWAWYRPMTRLLRRRHLLPGR